MNKLKSSSPRKVRTVIRIFNNSGWRGVVRHARNKMEILLFEHVVHRFNSERGYSHPRTVQIEASSNCNLRCPSCSLSREVNPGRNLSPDELRLILDRLPFRPDSVSLNGIGEPLVNPRFFELVDILDGRSISCSFFTNGTMLTPRLREAILSRRNVSYVGISCDGARKETFEALRYGAKFETWKEFVRDFLGAAHDRHPNPIQTTMSTVVSRRNLSELTGIVDLASELGFRSVVFSDVMPSDEVAASLAISQDDWAAYDKNGLVTRGNQRGLDVALNIRRTQIPPKVTVRCFQPWGYAMVSVEGDILPCCAIVGSDQAKVMGNLFQQDFGEIWSGSDFKGFRRSAAEGTNDLCNRCPYY